MATAKLKVHNQRLKKKKNQKVSANSDWLRGAFITWYDKQ